MELKEIVAAAKHHIVDLFGDDAASVPGLEEIVPVQGLIWDVTLSFRRRLPLASGGLAINIAPHLVNYEKIVRINGEDGAIVSVKDVESN